MPNDYRGQPWRHCMYDWQPHGGYFPKGLNWLANATGAGVMPYANYLCANSTYALTGAYRTMNGSHHGNVHPAESARFWRDRFADAVQVGGPRVHEYVCSQTAVSHIESMNMSHEYVCSQTAVSHISTGAPRPKLLTGGRGAELLDGRFLERPHGREHGPGGQNHALSQNHGQDHGSRATTTVRAL